MANVDGDGNNVALKLPNVRQQRAYIVRFLRSEREVEVEVASSVDRATAIRRGNYAETRSMAS